jgi:hypothetical protein
MPANFFGIMGIISFIFIRNPNDLEFVARVVLSQPNADHMGRRYFI